MIDALFKTNALKIAPAEEPFWYTSGLIGPFFVSTHFLCGGQNNSENILKIIDQLADKPQELITTVNNELDRTYAEDEIFKNIIDQLCAVISKNLDTLKIDYVSGGQRRDWFFAPIIAKKLNIPCLYIYNDQTIYNEQGEKLSSLQDQRVLNIADLLTVGSSYTDKWIPAVQSLGGKLVAAANIVDRNQGGQENLSAAGVEHFFEVFKIDQTFFETALESNYINKEQFSFVMQYMQDPFQSMHEWLLSNPDFIANSLQSDNEKTQARAQKMQELDLYKLQAN